MAKLGAGVDELEVDLLQGSLLGVRQEGLSQGKDTLLWSNATTLQQDKVLLDLPVVREATHGGDGFISEVVICGGIVLHQLQ